MPFSQLNKIQISPKPESGCGDGATTVHQHHTVKPRVQIPSCRKFATRAPPQTPEIKLKVEHAINKLTNNSNVTRIRSLTIAEITPSRNLNKKTALKPHAKVTSQIHVQNAARCVYQQLVINAWRERRRDVTELTESVVNLQQQTADFRVQVDALQLLRKSEGERRQEAVSEKCTLKLELAQLHDKNEVMQEEKRVLEKQNTTMESKLENLILKVENARNELSVRHGELRATEQQLIKERDKLRHFRDENRQLLEKLAKTELEASHKQEIINTLQNSLIKTKNCLHDAESTNHALENDKSQLLLDLENENKLNNELNNSVEESLLKRKQLETKIHTMKKKLSFVIQEKQKLQESNNELTNTLDATNAALDEEKNRSWWKNATELSWVSLHALKSVASVVLPALPDREEQL